MYTLVLKKKILKTIAYEWFSKLFVWRAFCITVLIVFPEDVGHDHYEQRRQSPQFPPALVGHGQRFRGQQWHDGRGRIGGR